MSTIPPPLPPSSPPPGFMPPPIPQPLQQPEIVRSLLENLEQKTGVFSKQTYRLLITDQRLIFVLQQKNGIDYLHQDPSLSLAENPANFEIPLHQLIRIETYSAGMDDSSPDYMIVISDVQKLRFNIKNYYKVQRQLKEILGNKAT